MAKDQCEDGINEVWWDREMAKPIPELKPIKTRVKLPDVEQWDVHTKDAHGNQEQGARIQWETDLYNTLASIRYLLEENAALGLLSGNTLAILRLAKTSLESEFPDHQDENPF